METEGSKDSTYCLQCRRSSERAFHRRGLYLLVILMIAHCWPAFAQTEILTNGGFESGSAGWSISGDFHADSRFSTSRSGTGYAYLSEPDGTSGNNLSGTLYQTLSIPSTASSATLTFWYNITTQESPGGSAFDFLEVSIRNPSGSFLESVASLSNLNSQTLGQYAQRSFNLAAYIGQTIRIHFSGTTDFSLPTTFRIDDVSVTATLTSPPGSFTLWNETPFCDTQAPAGPAVRLNWTASSGADTYEVFRGGASLLSGITGTSFLNNLGLIAGQTYTYFVRASNSAGSRDSNTISVTIPSGVCDSSPGSFTLWNDTPYCDTQAPAGPAVRLNWTTSSSASSYEVFRDGVSVLSGITGNTFLNNLGLNAGQTYSYFVRASNAAGSRDSNAISVSIPSGVCDSLPGSFTLWNDVPYCDTQPPAGPAVWLNWTTSSGSESYEVFRDGVSLLSGITGTTFLNNLGLSAGQTYTYFVRASNFAGDVDSNTIDVSIPGDICSGEPPSGISLKLPLPGGRRWLLTTQAGGDTCLSPDPVPSHMGSNYFSLDFDDYSQESGPETEVPVYAASAGVITEVGVDANAPNGFYTAIDHDGDGNRNTGYTTRYLHLKYRPLVSVGNVVRAGERLGIVGATGDAEGSHLHFGVRFQNDGSTTVGELRSVLLEGMALESYAIDCSGDTDFYLSTNVLFASGFESGNFTAWSTVVGN